MNNLIEETPYETRPLTTGIETGHSDLGPCRLVVFYADQEAMAGAERLAGSLRATLDTEVPLQFAWWKFSVLGDRLMSQLAVEDADQANVLLFAFGATNEIPDELERFNAQWIRGMGRVPRILALHLSPEADGSEETRDYFAQLAKLGELDFLSSDSDVSPRVAINGWQDGRFQSVLANVA